MQPIAIDDLSFSYPGSSQTVLNNVSWHMEAGSFTALIGPNGGGKTTLLKLALGLLKSPQGQIRLLGEAPQQSRHRVGYIAQRDHIDDTCPHSALDVVLTGCLHQSRWGFRYNAAQHKAAADALERVGLLDKMHEALGALSGGQRQRVRLARALAGKAELLILDEPLTGIDPANEANLLKLLHEINSDHSIVMVSHDIACVSQHVSHVLCCNRQASLHEADSMSPEALHNVYHSHAACRPITHDPATCPFTEPS